jgi:hypothetical protein
VSEPTIEAEPLAEVRPIEHWQTQHGVAPWLHRGAVYLHHWGVGRELTEAEYLNGVEAMASARVEA